MPTPQFQYSLEHFTPHNLRVDNYMWLDMKGSEKLLETLPVKRADA
jgi:hypothetical protein